MALRLLDKVIERVGLIDDEEQVRTGYRYQVENLEMSGQEIVGPIRDITSLINDFNVDSDAVICDYNLKVRNYSVMNGEEIVASLYVRHMPVILCTRLEHMPQPIRRNKRRIPIILKPEDLTSDNIRNGFLTCINEYNGKFSAPRRPWKTLIRIEGGELSNNDQYVQVNAVIPSWDSSVLLNFEWPVDGNEALKTVRENLKIGEISRIYATVNAGTEDSDELFIEEWSLN